MCSLLFVVMGKAIRGVGLGGKFKSMVFKSLTLKFWVSVDTQAELLSKQNMSLGFTVGDCNLAVISVQMVFKTRGLAQVI